MLRPLIQPRLKQVLAQRVSSRLWVLATGPRGGLGPNVTFFAEYSSDVNDSINGVQGNFARNSPALYRDTQSVWRQAAVNEPRFQLDGYLTEPGPVTGKCINFNVQPDAGLTGVTVNGTGTLARVADTSELTAAGMGVIGNGFAFEIDSRGQGVTDAVIAGVTGNTNLHQLVSLLRKVDGNGTCDLRTSGGGIVASAIAVAGGYQLVHISGFPLATDTLMIRANDCRCRFVLNDFQEGEGYSHPIAHAGAAATRQLDTVTYSSLLNWLNQTQGTVALEWVSHANSSDLVAGQTRTIGTVSLRSSNFSMHTAQKSSGDVSALVINSLTGSQTEEVPDFQAGDRYKIAIRWSTTPDEMGVGYSKNGAAWVWSGNVAYGGSWRVDGQVMRILRVAQFSCCIKRLAFWNVRQSRAWIESNY